MGCTVRVPGSNRGVVSSSERRHSDVRGAEGSEEQGAAGAWSPSQPSRIDPQLKVLRWKIWELPAPALPPFPAQSPRPHRGTAALQEKATGKLKNLPQPLSLRLKGPEGAEGIDPCSYYKN